LFDEAFNKIRKEISRRPFATLKSTFEFEAKTFIFLSRIETSRLMDINGFSDLSVDECRCYVTLDGYKLQFYGQNHNNLHCQPLDNRSPGLKIFDFYFLSDFSCAIVIGHGIGGIDIPAKMAQLAKSLSQE
jgi:hypothetical protein